MKQWKIVSGILMVFLLGVLAGALLEHRVYQHRLGRFYRGGPQAAEDAIVRRLSRDLSMDDAQREQLRGIVHEAQAEIAPIRRQIRPRVEEIIEGAQAKVREILHPDQQQKFDKLVAERKARMEKRYGQEGVTPLPR